MHTVDLLDEAIALAAQLGYTVRHEVLDGRSGGPCELNGHKLLFVDLALPPADQFDQVRSALVLEDDLAGAPMSPPLARLLACRKSA